MKIGRSLQLFPIECTYLEAAAVHRGQSMPAGSSSHSRLRSANSTGTGSAALIYGSFSIVQGVKHASGRGEPLPVEIRKFDWHLFLRQAREMQTAEELWISLSPFVTPLGMALGTLPASGNHTVLN